jgi:hypothetical protein
MLLIRENLRTPGAPDRSQSPRLRSENGVIVARDSLLAPQYDFHAAAKTRVLGIIPNNDAVQLGEEEIMALWATDLLQQTDEANRLLSKKSCG